MKDFKFFRSVAIKAHDGGYIYSGQVFYSMNKQEIPSVMRPDEMIPKYTIVRRCVHPKFEHVFKPDYNALWYFKSKQNAEYLKTIWERQDMQSGGGERFHNEADFTITFGGE